MTSDSSSDVGTSPSKGLTAAAAAAVSGDPILVFGRGWMMAPGTAERAAQLGFGPGFGIWVNGRAGVLGEVHGDVAAAAIGFMEPSMTRTIWGDRPTSISPQAATAAYAEAAATWGRQVLADVASTDLERLAVLADRVAAAADPSIGILFAGWRALERPPDPAGRVTIALNVLRELRGGAHLAAVHSVGIGPHGAIMAADDPVRGGVNGAERFGWPAPHPTPDPARRRDAEHLTTGICAPAFEALDEAERQEFVALVEQVRAAAES